MFVGFHSSGDVELPCHPLLWVFQRGKSPQAAFR